jgi:hypothetical protein
MHIKSWTLAIAGLLLLVTSSAAQNFNFVAIDVPDANATSLQGISPNGDIVGVYVDSSSDEHGFLYSGGSFTPIEAPGTLVGVAGTLIAEPNGINAAGDIVGDYIAPPGAPGAPDCVVANKPPCVRGFLLSHGEWSDVLVPNHAGSVPNSINTDGSIYGCLHDQTFGIEMYGFVRTHSGDYKTLQAGGGELAGSSQSVPNSMNNGGTLNGKTIVGLYTPSGSLPHGYIVRNGVFSDYMVPGSIATQIWGINPEGDFVGFYRTKPGPAGLHGFVVYADTPTPVTVDYPGAMRTQALAINPSGAIVGTFVDQAGAQHGFLAVPITTD